MTQDPSVIGEKASSVGAGGKQPLTARKRRKISASSGVNVGNVGGGSEEVATVDPLKAVKGFVKATKRGGGADEEMTEMEVGNRTAPSQRSC
jgi:hypothetical protein